MDSPVGAAMGTVVPAQFEREHAFNVDSLALVNTLPFIAQPTLPTTVTDVGVAGVVASVCQTPCPPPGTESSVMRTTLLPLMNMFRADMLGSEMVPSR